MNAKMCLMAASAIALIPTSVVAQNFTGYFGQTTMSVEVLGPTWLKYCFGGDCSALRYAVRDDGTKVVETRGFALWVAAKGDDAVSVRYIASNGNVSETTANLTTAATGSQILGVLHGAWAAEITVTEKGLRFCNVNGCGDLSYDTVGNGSILVSYGDGSELAIVQSANDKFGASYYNKVDGSVAFGVFSRKS